ncbi:MAG: DUF308 domain-containing protein [Candidatus Nitrosopolaris sp.]
MRTVQIGLGILIIIFSIIAFFFLVSSFLPLHIELAIILFFIGIEKIITGAYRVGKYKWIIIVLGLLVIICAGIALSFHVPYGYGVIIFLAISVLASGAARIADGIHKESKRSKSFVIGVGALNIVVSVVIILNASSVLAGRSVAILLLISGIQTLASGLGNK